MDNLPLIIAFILTVLLLCSCSSLYERRENQDRFRYYPGIQLDAEILSDVVHSRGMPLFRFGPALSVLAGIYAVVDMPFSFVLDTLLLPYDALKPRHHE